MKHLIIVKFKENVWARESEASREMLADIRDLRSDAADRRRPYSEHLGNVTSRPNRHDLTIEMEMDPEALPVYDASAAHQEMEGKIRGRYSVQDYL